MKSSTVKTVTEIFLGSAICLDASEEPMYGRDQCLVSYPAVFPTVDLMLSDTEELVRIVDFIRIGKGYRPMEPRGGCEDADPEVWYNFHVGLNGYSETGLDSRIECVVCNAASDDNEDSYYLDLSREEQQIIFDLLDVQCREAFGKGCGDLLEEAGKELLN